MALFAPEGPGGDPGGGAARAEGSGRDAAGNGSTQGRSRQPGQTVRVVDTLPLSALTAPALARALGSGVGVAAAVAASVLFALGSVMQHAVASGGVTHRGLDLRRLVRSRTWLVGQGATVVGTGLQILALGLAPIALVQPVLAAGLVVALGIRAVRDHRVPSASDLLGAACTFAGLAVFLITARPVRGAPDRLPGPTTVLVAVLVAVLLVVLALRAGRDKRGALACGSAAGIDIAIATVLIAAALKIFERHGFRHALTSSALWGAVIVAVAAELACQQAFSRGELAWSLPPLSVLDPLVAVAAARLLLGERLEPGHAALWLPAAGLAAVGVVLLARSRQTGRQPRPTVVRARRPAQRAP